MAQWGRSSVTRNATGPFPLYSSSWTLPVFARSSGIWHAVSPVSGTTSYCRICITALGWTLFMAPMSWKTARSVTVCAPYARKWQFPPVMEDIGAMLNFIDAQDDAAPGLVGAHGYCMSGPYALAAAARYPDRISAAASFYGTWLVSDAEESPHLSLGKAKGELYIACAEHDDLAPLLMVEKLKGLFDKSGNPGELEVYPKVHHGFAFPQRWCYYQPAAERHWERLFALYERRLKAG